MAIVGNAAASNGRHQQNNFDLKIPSYLFLIIISVIPSLFTISLMWMIGAFEDDSIKFKVDSWEAKAKSSLLTTLNDVDTRALGLDLDLKVSASNGKTPAFFYSLLVLLESDKDASVSSSTKIEPFYQRPYNDRKTTLKFGIHTVLDQYDLRTKESSDFELDFTLKIWGTYWDTSAGYNEEEKIKIVCKGIKVVLHPSHSSLDNTMHGSSSGSPILCE